MFSKATFAIFALALVATAAPATEIEGRAAEISGRATYYLPENNYGACGTRIKNTDYAVALSSDQYGGGSHCGKKLKASSPPHPDNGHSVTVTVRDLCPGCAANSLDLTSSAFQQLAALSVGNIPVTWNWV
ncbi:barwin-like endoglucanase [Schizophyllum commune H4-8]|nr:barwin-like endoglucanase [Schizophyllum commune H4-8]KAI5900697.1 barwin-like endoglucanase [Schizophyllum commune H4-8]